MINSKSKYFDTTVQKISSRPVIIFPFSSFREAAELEKTTTKTKKDLKTDNCILLLEA